MLQSTSPQRGEVDLRSKSGEGAQLSRETATPHPALRADLSLWERWPISRALFQQWRPRHKGIEGRPKLRAIAVLFLQDFMQGPFDHELRARSQARGKSP